jgi:hypothetical protein
VQAQPMLAELLPVIRGENDEGVGENAAWLKAGGFPRRTLSSLPGNRPRERWT